MKNWNKWSSLSSIINIIFSKINLIGFHGHTIFHNFKEKKTKQIGDGKLLSQLTSLNVVNNFRENDINNGERCH